MIGGYIYNSRINRKSYRKSKSLRLSKNRLSKKNINAGKYRKSRRKSYRKLRRKLHRKLHRKLSRRKQRGGSPSNFNEAFTPTISSRLASGPYFNQIEGYTANLNNPPLEGFEAVKQCTDM